MSQGMTTKIGHALGKDALSISNVIIDIEVTLDCIDSLLQSFLSIKYFYKTNLPCFYFQVFLI